MASTQHVYAIFDDPDTAGAAYDDLRVSGCSGEHCSAIMHERHVDLSALPSGERAGTEGAVAGAAVAGSAGAILAGLAALGGGLVGIGPLAAAAFGGGVMAAYGGLTGGLAGSDEAEKHLRALADDVEAGKILIAVETDDADLEEKCKKIFAKHGGRQVVA